MLPNNPKHTRRNAPKARTGCGTCKIRRVKCGEEKPNCHRCIAFGVSCEGYRDPRKSSTKPRVLHALLPRAKGPPRIERSPSTSLYRNENDYRYFEVFCSKTAYEILPSFDTGTLREMLLQASHQEPSIRHAVSALGAVYVASECIRESGSISLDDRRLYHTQHQRNALEQYTIAIKHMQAAVSSGRQDLRTMLLACLVNTCFEAWSGNHQLAMRQIRTGLQLLKDWVYMLASKPKIFGSVSVPDHIVEDDLIRAFIGLEVNAICDHRSPEDHIVYEQQERQVIKELPKAFTSVREAGIHKTSLKVRVMHFESMQAPLPPPPLHDFTMNNWWGEVSSHTMLLYRILQDDITLWNASFDPLWTKLKVEESPDRLAAALLRMQMKTIRLFLLVSCVQDEATFDDYEVDFLDIIDLAEYVLNSNKPKRHNFQIDAQVLLPLLMTGHKCRDMAIRRRAISLMLKHPRREGIWDSICCAKVAQWIMDLEEAHLVDGLVPGWARIRGVTATRDINDIPTLTCVQRTSEMSWEVVPRQKLMKEIRIRRF